MLKIKPAKQDSPNNNSSRKHWLIKKTKQNKQKGKDYVSFHAFSINLFSSLPFPFGRIKLP